MHVIITRADDFIVYALVAHFALCASDRVGVVDQSSPLWSLVLGSLLSPRFYRSIDDTVGS
jgi:hypothetical protein